MSHLMPQVKTIAPLTQRYSLKLHISTL